MSKIALNMIVRNCADYITKALDSTKGQVDYYVIGYGGESEDNTVEVVEGWLKKNSKNYFTLNIKWEDDFGGARQEVLEYTREKFDADWLFWMDADDVLVSKANLHEIADRGKGECIQFPYFYQFDENGRVIVWHSRERLVHLSLPWQWIRPVHETLYTTVPHTIVYSEDAALQHDSAKSAEFRTERNRKILLKWLEEHPEDKRTNLYVGHSHYANQEWDKAIEWFAKYFFQPENPLEEWSAAVFAGRCAFNMEDYEQSVQWFTQALNIRPEWKDSYIGLGQAHTKLGNFDAAVEFFKQSDSKDKPPNVLFIVENEYNWNRYAYEHQALANTGRIQEAYEVCEKALEIDPNHTGFNFWKMGYMEALSAEKSINSIKHLVMTLLRRGDGLKAVKLLDSCVPANIEEEPELNNLRKFVVSSIEQVWNPALLEYMNDVGGRPQEHVKNIGSEAVFDWCENRARIQSVERLLQPHLDRAKELGRPLKVVDLACGGGGITMYLANKYDIEILGVDHDKKSIASAKYRAKKWGLSDKAKFKKADLKTVEPKKLGEFDVALLQEVVEHTDQPGWYVGLAADLAEVIIITTPHQSVVMPNPGEIINPTTGTPMHPHVIEFSRRDMERLSGAVPGYSVENLWPAYEENSAIPGFGNWAMELRKQLRPFPPVVFFCGASGGEEWTPHQIDERGLGGSETAAVRVAQEFSKRGYPTIVFGSVDGVYDGVIYRKADKFDPEKPAIGNRAWLFISSRIPDIVDEDVNAMVKVLWCHDNTFKIPSPMGMTIDRLTEERAEKFDYVLVLSNWAKQFMKEQYPFLTDEQLVVTANGINPDNFIDLPEKRVKHSFIWASSLDRGLENVLDEWANILKKWPNATLDIFYGLDVMERLHGHLPEAQEFMSRIRTKANQKGVNWRGRIGQKELAKEFGKHQFWFYPTKFEETFCITALEAQAAGCIPCTTDVAALKERVPEEFIMNGKKPIRKLIELDQDYKELPEKYRNAALSFTWDKVAKQWEDLTKAKIGGTDEQNTGHNS